MPLMHANSSLLSPQNKPSQLHPCCAGVAAAPLVVAGEEEEEEEEEDQLSLFDCLCPSLGYQCDLVLDHLSLCRP